MSPVQAGPVAFLSALPRVSACWSPWRPWFSLGETTCWGFTWQTWKCSLSLALGALELCLSTRIMRIYELTKELCFCLCLANLWICVYLIFILKFAASIGRKRKCWQQYSVTSLHPSLAKIKTVNITTILSEYSYEQPSLVLSEYFEQYRFLCVYIIKHIYFFHVI